MLLLIFVVAAIGKQTKAQTKALQIGDNLSSLPAYQSIKPKTTEGFLLLFINSTCKDYQNILTEADSLARLSTVPIRAITTERKDEMAKGMWKKYQNELGIKWINEDKIWNQYFPHRLQPHVVWINNVGRVVAISDVSAIQLQQLSNFKNDSTLRIPVKKDILDFDLKQQLIIDRYPSGIMSYSLIKPYIPGTAPAFGVKKDTIRKTVRTYLLNMSLFKMYMMAFGKAFFWTPNRLIWALEDRSAFLKDYSDLSELEWQKRYSYTYESVLPMQVTNKERLQKIIDDLNLQFGLHCRKENRVVPVWLLLRTGEIKVPNKQKPLNTLSGKQAIKELRNSTLNSFLSYYNSQESHQPVIDETNYEGRIDLSLAVADLNDITTVNAALKPYHLKLVAAKRELEFIVFSPKN